MSTQIEQADEAFALGTCAGAVLMVWRGAATLDRLRAASALVRRVVDADGRTAVISVIEPGAPPPGPAEREDLARDMRALAPSIVGAAFVLEGGGELTRSALQVSMVIDALRREKLTRKYCVDAAEGATWLAARCRQALREPPSREALLEGVEKVRAAIVSPRELSLELLYADEAVAMGAYGRFVIMTWRGVPTEERLRKGSELVHARAVACGGQVGVVSCIEQGSPVPTPSARRVLARDLAVLAPQLQAVALVFEGGGRWASIALDAATHIDALRGGPLRRKYCVGTQEASAWLNARCRHLPGTPSRAQLVDAVERVRAAIG